MFLLCGDTDHGGGNNQHHAAGCSSSTGVVRHNARHDASCTFKTYSDTLHLPGHLLHLKQVFSDNSIRPISQESQPTHNSSNIKQCGHVSCLFCIEMCWKWKTSFRMMGMNVYYMYSIKITFYNWEEKWVNTDRRLRCREEASTGKCSWPVWRTTDKERTPSLPVWDTMTKWKPLESFPCRLNETCVRKRPLPGESALIPCSKADEKSRCGIFHYLRSWIRQIRPDGFH